MKRRLFIVAVLAGALGVWVGWAAHSYLIVDSCLDGGGRWAEHGDRCEGIVPPIADKPQTTSLRTLVVFDLVPACLSTIRLP